MSIQTDIMAALATLGPNKVWPQAVPEEIAPPFVVYRALSKEPVGSLDNSQMLARFIVAFECYADDFAGALSLAAQVDTLMMASGMNVYRETMPGEDYIPLTDGFMEPVFVGIWHTL